MIRIWILLTALLLGQMVYGQQGEPVRFAWEDPEKIQTVEACRQCHASEFDVWKKTPHAKGFKTLHRKQAAQDIAARMGFKLIKRESLCLTCHYTAENVKDTIRATAGVSCESCHGASADWIDVHNNYGGKGVTFETETPEHKANRIAQSRAAGMRRPSDMYDLAARCFQCHTVPDERLVNVGGHGTGSSDFELSAWSQGEIRHNFLQSFLTGDGTENAESSLAHKRVLFLLGRALDVEYSMRGLAVAQEKRRYFKAMSRRLRVAMVNLREVQRRVQLPELESLISLARKADTKLGNREALLETAQAMGTVTKMLVAKLEGESLAALDPLLEGREDELPEIDDAVAFREDSPSTAIEETVEPVVTPENTEPSRETEIPRTSSQTRPSPATSRRGVTGAFKQRVRQPDDHATLGPGKCSSCHRHEKQSTWWFDDPHFASADAFLSGNRKNLQIATLYGLQASKMTRGDQLCMDCHGTIVSGKERREVIDGVSCESCHGGAASYLEPHQEGDPNQGEQRTGYVAAIAAGMVKTKDAGTAAKRCADCHYITEERLLSAGHPSGADFAISDGMNKIKHWERDVQDARIREAYSQVLAARGPVPRVEVATPIVPSSTPAEASGGSSSPEDIENDTDIASDPNIPTQSAASRVSRPAKPRPRPVDKRSLSSGTGEVGQLELPPFPDIGADTPVEDLLLLLKQRLELIHQRLNKPKTGEKSP